MATTRFLMRTLTPRSVLRNHHQIKLKPPIRLNHKYSKLPGMESLYPQMTYTHVDSEAEVLKTVDEMTSSTGDTFVEYIFTKPSWNIKLWKLDSSTNPYGHSVIRYTRPDKSTTIMNVSGARGCKMIYFFDPTSYMFAKKTEEGNEQGGINNRSFISIKINNVNQALIDKMHEHYVDVAKKKQAGEVDFGVIFYSYTNRIRSFVSGKLDTLERNMLDKVRDEDAYFDFAVLFYAFTSWLRPLVQCTVKGNCAYWTSSGMVRAKLLKTPYSWPLLIWFKLLANNFRRNRKSINIVAYRSINYKTEPAGSLIYPFYWFKHRYSDIWNLEAFANIVVKFDPPDNCFKIKENTSVFDKWIEMYKKFKEKMA